MVNVKAHSKGTPKGWVKEKSQYSNQIYYSNGKTTVFVSKNIINVGAVRESSYWDVVISPPYPKISYSPFYSKSKSEALAFAKDWMNKHPNG